MIRKVDVKSFGGLCFHEDVVKERSYHCLPYDNKYLKVALDSTKFKYKKDTKSHLAQGRHNASYCVKRHAPCLLKPISVKNEHENNKTTEDHLHSEHFSSRTSSMDSEVLEPSVLGAPDDRKYRLRRESTLKNLPIEKVTLSLVSLAEIPEVTAIPSIADEMNRNSYSGLNIEIKAETSKKKWKNSNENFLDKVRALTKSRGIETDPYGDDTASTFYRLPDGIRRQKKQLLKTELGAINSSAHNIKVIPYEPPPPPGLRDLLPKNVGNKIFETDNTFQQERLVGVNQISQYTNGKTNEESKLIKIVLENDNQYKKCLQSEVPFDPTQWYPRAKRSEKSEVCSSFKPRLGIRHWTGLPSLIQAGTPDRTILESQEKKLIPESNRKMARSNDALVAIVNDWRLKWNLDMRYADATPDQLIADMADTHVHIRLKAITTCARASEFRPINQAGIQLVSDQCQVTSDEDELNEPVHRSNSSILPENLYSALECCLSDNSEQVQRAAAITLYTLERPNEEAEAVLREMLYDTRLHERWPAAQCLAYYGECDSEVVGELISQLLNTTEMLRNEQAIFLLSKLSENSTLVNSMLAELLNSSTWRNRFVACNSLPKLMSKINRDVVNKLLEIMWTDWHCEVRRAASHALGRCGQGKAVHDSLIEKLTNAYPEREQLEALKKIAQLGIMTAKLMPPYLDCFNSSYESIRLHACVASYNLMIKDERVITQLVKIASDDITWKVKAIAIQALGKIGIVNNEVVDTILWAFRYEKKASVRAQACHTIIELGLNDSIILKCLQDRYLIELDKDVREQIVKALEMCQVTPTSDMDMIATIKDEVNKLCVKENICAQIKHFEKEKSDRQGQERLIFNASNITSHFTSDLTSEITSNRTCDIYEQHEHHEPHPPATAPTAPTATPATPAASNDSPISQAVIPHDKHPLDDIQSLSDNSSANSTIVDSEIENLEEILDENEQNSDLVTSGIKKSLSFDSLTSLLKEVERAKLQEQETTSVEQESQSEQEFASFSRQSQTIATPTTIMDDDDDGESTTTSIASTQSIHDYILYGVGDAYSIVGDFCSRYAEFGIPSSEDVAFAWDNASSVC